LRSPLFSGKMPPTFWKQILIVFFVSFLVVDPTFLDDLDIVSPHPRMEQDPSLWVVPFGWRVEPEGGPPRSWLRALVSCKSAGFASGKA